MLRVLNIIGGNGRMPDLRAAVRAVCAWDGQAPLITTWHRGNTVITDTLKCSRMLENGIEVPAGVDLRRPWILEAFARGMGLLVTRRPRPDGTAGVYYLDDAGRWVALACDDPVDALAPWFRGASAVIRESRLAALVLRPSAHLLTYHGVIP